MNILERANDVVNGARQDAYGHPLDNFNRIAAMWSVILEREVTAEQVGLCMAALKIARQVHSPKIDNLVDLAGYAQTVEMVIGERVRRQQPDGPIDHHPV